MTELEPDRVTRWPEAVERADDGDEAAVGSLGDVVRVGASIVRLGAGASLRVAGWYATGSRRVTSRLVRAAVEGEPTPQLVHEMVEELREQVRALLGIDELVELSELLVPPEPTSTDAAALQRRAAELLRRSTDVTYTEPFHPAYGRILDLLAPDEARILRLLTREGPQPTVDVRTSNALPGSSELLARGLSMIAASAGCRFTERVPAYLNNLTRLGLVWATREPIDDLGRYQVLEAQPEVLAALDGGRRARTVRGSLQLTPFGEDFCHLCMPPETTDGPHEG